MTLIWNALLAISIIDMILLLGFIVLRQKKFEKSIKEYEKLQRQ
jgi:hypothetical protein